MSYLILGSSGQIGDALCEYYDSKNISIEKFDIVDNDFQDLRINSNTILEDKIRSSEFVFFLAFDVGGSRYLKKYENTFDFVDNNMKIMSNTFELLKKYNKPFIFASSQMSNMGYSPYGQLKRIGEIYTEILGGIVVKFWNVYGVEKDLEKSHVITDFIIKAKNKKIIDMLTDGTEERQFLYSDDCCEALDTTLKNYNTISREREIHITNHRWDTILSVAKEVTKHFPAQVIPAEKKDEVQKNKKNEADPYILEFWTPKTSLADGIEKICNHYKGEK